MSSAEIKYGDKVANNVYFVKQLDNLGINKKYIGYYLLIEIMDLLINQERRINSFSKEVYPLIAKKYGKSDCTIERNIRSLIERYWSKELMEKLNVYYPEMHKPSCRDFIFLIKNYITIQIL